MPSAIKKLQDKQWLTVEYVENFRSSQSIADEVGCNKSAVCRALARHGIEVRKRTAKYTQLADEAWLRTKYIDEKRSLNEIADMAGSTPGNVHAHLTAKGIDIRSHSEGIEARYPDGRNGEDASNWKGGRKKANSMGYIHAYAPDHPYATKAGYVMEHRLVMEAQLGRYLEPSEDVHHINEDTSDNRSENLIVVSRSEHKQIHSLLRRTRKLEAENKRLKTKLSKVQGQI